MRNLPVKIPLCPKVPKEPLPQNLSANTGTFEETIVGHRVRGQLKRDFIASLHLNDRPAVSIIN